MIYSYHSFSRDFVCLAETFAGLISEVLSAIPRIPQTYPGDAGEQWATNWSRRDPTRYG